MPINDLEMLQWTLNNNLEVGANEVRRADVLLWLDPLPVDFSTSLRRWQDEGLIEILRPIDACKAKDVCFKLLKPFALAHR